MKFKHFEGFEAAEPTLFQDNKSISCLNWYQPLSCCSGFSLDWFGLDRLWARLPVSGGMSVSVTISPSSMVVSELIWSRCGSIWTVWQGVIPSLDVTVLLGISSAGSMSSCLMISSASTAWPGESEPGVAEGDTNREIWETAWHPLDQVARYSCQPVLVAGEKKLKTGEKMVPSRVVRGGLLGESMGASSLPFGLMGLLLQVIVSEIHNKTGTVDN